MFYEQRMTVPDTPEALAAHYHNQFAEVVTAVGREQAVTTTGIDATRLAALESGDPALSLEEAAALVALEEGEPDPETVVEIACEHLLLGMSMAVLDVEALASRLELELDAKEIQQKLERRAPMTFGEFVYFQHAIVSSIP